MNLQKKLYPTMTRNNKDELTRACSLDIKNLNENERRISVSFSSEQPYERWFGTEILQHDNDSVDLQRLKEIGVSLFNHNRNYVIGKLENIRLENERCYADIIFDDDEESEKIFKKVKNGSLKGVSVGYRVDRWEDVSVGEKSSNGKFTGPVSIAAKWTPFEVSIVSIPADDSVGVGRQFEDNQQKNISNTQPEKENLMNLKELCRQLGLDYDALIGRGMTSEQIEELTKDLSKKNEPVQAPKKEETNIEAERQEAAKAEKQRTLEITKMCRDFDVNPNEYIEKDSTVEDVRAAVLEKMKAERSPIPAGSGNITVTQDEADKIRNAASDGLMMRAGVRPDKPADGSNDFRGMSLRDLAIDCLLRTGVNNAHRLDAEEVFRRAVTPDSQFTSILSDSVNKSMGKAYATNPTTYRNWVGIGSNSDFKDATHYRISEAGELKRMTQQGEFQFDEMQDTSVKKSLVTYGRKFGFTRQAMINDDLGILTKIPQAYVKAADRGVNKLVYAILGGNPKIYDGPCIISC